jgi:hypothetical protein
MLAGLNVMEYFELFSQKIRSHCPGKNWSRNPEPGSRPQIGMEKVKVKSPSDNRSRFLGGKLFFFPSPMLQIFWIFSPKHLAAKSAFSTQNTISFFKKKIDRNLGFKKNDNFFDENAIVSTKNGENSWI